MEARAEPSALPPLFRSHVRRPRLTRLIDESQAQAVVVIGPPGYGKTTLAREWAQGRDNVVWYTATPSSADVAAFSVELADAVSPVVPGAGGRLGQRVRVPEAPEKAARPYAELLAKDLSSWPPDAWLIVDNYHLVANSAPVEEFVDWLLTLAPSLRLLVTTRRRPKWLSAKRILHGEVAELDKDQLGMTTDEAHRMLIGRTTESVRALVRQAEGWPALIGLASLAASAEFPNDRISGSLFRYFADEVLRQEPVEMQNFMLVASVPASVSVRVGRDVLEVEDPERFLEGLETGGLIHRSSAEGSVFHPLLREFLRRKLLSEQPTLAAIVALRAISDARAARRWDEAFQLATETQSLELAAEIVGDATPELLAKGRIETVEKWLELCGSAIFEHPESTLAQSEVLLRRGQLSECAAVAEDVATRLPEDHPKVSRAWFVAGHARYLLSQYPAAVRCHKCARELASTPAALKDALWGLASTANELGAIEAAGEYLLQLDGIGPCTIDDRLRIASGRVAVGCHSGTLAGVWEHFEPLLAQARHGRDPMVISSFMALAAYLRVAEGNYRRALRLSTEAVKYCHELGLSFAVGFCLVHQAGAEIGLRQSQHARKTLDALGTVLRDSEDPFILLERAVVEMKYAMTTEGPASALRYLPALPHGPLPPAPHAEILALEAIARASVGETGRASSLIASVFASTKAVEAHYYASFADLIIRCHDDAVATSSALASQVANLLRRTGDAAFLDAFVVAYRAYPRLLRLALLDESSHALLRRIVDFANDGALARNAGMPLETTSRVRADSLESLTRREKEILLLMSEGLSNPEIARRLFISLSTTKVHVRHVLRKLGVRTRLQAILHARDLDPS